ncbi:hypothetical protein DPMN_040453 [Dreissena polymorpha]|uniref:Tafazzin family protein n=1 Tax=Dreissena polymorpha TaxID=45954 RepID=A0A9D4CXQ8_DREPO|nr:hypothetical protein DPMN_040453 [Dreissena polymorpha]
MDFCAERLSVGEWVHIFPEGKINMEHKYLRLKWGVGRLVADSAVSPLVLPYWHVGMDDIWPNKAPDYPRTGKEGK